MRHEPSLSLEQLAALTVRMEAGVARERVLAEAGISADAWEGIRTAWLSRMAEEAGRNSRALHRRYTELLQQLRTGQSRHGSVRSVAGPIPVAPISQLSPLHAHPQLGAGHGLPERQPAMFSTTSHAAEPDAAVQTMAAVPVAHGNPLPFAPADPRSAEAGLPASPPLPARDGNHDDGTTTVSSGVETRPAWGNPLPFQPSAPQGQPTSTGEQAAVPASVLSLVQYASLCAELTVFPDASESIFLRAGLADLSRRSAEDAVWKERLRREPDTYRAWGEHYRYYCAVWTTEARRRGR